MRAITAKLAPLARSSARQILPPVLATLIAAALIAGFNRAFSGHLVQPRMAALHSAAETTRPIVYASQREREEMPVTEVTTVSEPALADRSFAKDVAREAGKDEPSLKVASAPAAAPVAPAPVAAAPAPVVAAPAPVAAAPAPAPAPRATRKSEPQRAEPQRFDQQRIEQVIERRAEPRVAAVPVVVGPAPVMVAPAPAMPAPPVAAQPIAPLPQPPIANAQPGGPMMGPVTQEPPPVITAKPMVTVPDRPRQVQGPYPGAQAPYPGAQAPYPGAQQAPYAGYEPRTPYYDQQAQRADDLGPPREPPRPFERFVDSLKPSSIFNRMREFGDRIEAAGNEILPTIRQ